MDGFLRVNTAATTLPTSPTNLYLADEVASTCPLITPSPPTNDLINPTSENSDPPKFIIGDELASKLQHVQDDDKTGGDSASSTSSVLAEPVCTQLLNHRHHYQHITKDENTSTQETNGKVQPLQLTFRNPPDYFFMKWNWHLIRKISTWAFLSGLMAMTALVISMISSLPRTCNPPTQWYQGNLFYEIFPGSFHDTDDDGIGDLKGISFYADYIQRLGVRAVRLNSIFESVHYPENYKNVTSLLEIDPKLGSLKDFKILRDALFYRNISLVLDLPMFPTVTKLTSHEVNEFNDSEFRGEFMKRSAVENPNSDVITEALLFWRQYGVDGFYLKGLENFVHDQNFVPSLRKWKKILGPDRVLIVHRKVIDDCPKKFINALLNNVDLIDIHLVVENGVEDIRAQLDTIQNGTLFSKPHMPWVHWSLGDVDSTRLASRLHLGNATLGAILLQLMLPGTPSIFYGDEVGMQQIDDKHGDRRELQDLHQLGPMIWEEPKLRFTKYNLLPWMHGVPTHSNFNQFNLIAKMVRLRSESPSIYLNAVQKDGNNKANAEIKYSQEDLLVIQRYYPRRKSFVVVSNLGSVRKEADLSKLLYSGTIVVGPQVDSKSGSISFKQISLWPGESVIVTLD